MPWPYSHPGKAPVNPPPDNGLSWFEITLLFLGSAVAAYCLARAYMGDC